MAEAKFIDLSHTIRDGLITYKGLPAPIVCDFLSREASEERYEGAAFHIGRIDMVANTGTYMDAPFHRFEDGHDVAGFDLSRIADLPGICVDATNAPEGAVGSKHFDGLEVEGRAVLVRTGWDRHWNTDTYFEGNPYLTEGAAILLRDRGAVLVGIDSLNIDCTDTGTRPVHTALLGADIAIIEHMTRLDQLPVDGFRVTAVPPKIEGLGTFPVRIFATMD